MDAYNIDNIPDYRGRSGKVFAKPLATLVDVSGFPTDEVLQLDFINTMRLFYGRPSERSTETDEDRRVRGEWEKCKDAMERWLRIGAPEDFDSVAWGCMPPNVLSAMKGKELREYAKFVDRILIAKKEQVPEFFGRFSDAFRNIGDDHEDNEEQEEALVGEELPRCPYDRDRCESFCPFDLKEGRKEMQEECEIDCEGGSVVVRRPLRPVKDVLRGARVGGSNTAKQDGGGADRRRKPNYRKRRRGTDAQFPAPTAVVDIDTFEDGKSTLIQEHGELNVLSNHNLSTSKNVDPDAGDENGSSMANKKKKKPSISTISYQRESKGIGLAWTIIRRFFTGTNVAVENDDIVFLHDYRKRIQHELDRTMELVLLYVLGLESEA